MGRAGRVEEGEREKGIPAVHGTGETSEKPRSIFGINSFVIIIGDLIESLKYFLVFGFKCPK